MRLFHKMIAAIAVLAALCTGVVPVLAAQRLLDLSHGAAPGIVAQTAKLDPNAPTVAARAGFGDTGAYVMGEWFPVQVTLDNPATGNNIKGRVEISLLDDMASGSSTEAGRYARDVDLPPSSHKQVTLYTYSGSFNHSIQVRLTQGSVTLASANVSVDPQQIEANAIVGVISPDSSLLNIYKGEPVGYSVNPPQQNNYGGPNPPAGQQSPRALVAHMGLADVPVLASAVTGLSVLVIDDTDTGALSPEQHSALASWVSSGGTLLLTARQGVAGPLAGLGDLSPVTASGSRTLTGLQALSDPVMLPITPTAAIVVPDARVISGEGASRVSVLAVQNGVPLVAARSIGQGQVVYMALSPGAEPLKGWDGTVPLLRRVFAPHQYRVSFGAIRRSGNLNISRSQMFYAGEGLFDLPGLQLPPGLFVGFFLLVYIAIVGPLNYIVLKRLRRSELAWVTIPVMVALFSVGAYVIGYQSKGGDVIALRSNILHTEPGISQAYAQQFMGLFSPTRSTYGLGLGSESAVTEITPFGGSVTRPATVLGGATTHIEDVNINTWSLRAFMAESSIPAESPLDADLHLGNNTVEGTLRNRSTSPLQDVALVQGNTVQYVGYMAPGASVPVSLAASSGTLALTSPVSLLPLPPGVEDPGQGGGYISNYGPPVFGRFGSSGSSQPSDAQRTYNRRVELMNVALQEILTSTPPGDLSVTSLAWGPGPPTGFQVEGHSARTEDQSIWTGRLSVKGSDRGQLTGDRVPYNAYMPSADPSWKPAGSYSLELKPYSDLIYRFPAGTRPQKLTLHYGLDNTSMRMPVDILAYNSRTGAWDTLLHLGVDASPAMSDFSLPQPQDYIASNGEVTLRFVAAAGSSTDSVSFSSFNLSLNPGQQ